jgi:predicted hydrocarbon binding protein
MGQNQPLELTEEEKRELSIGLLREWWIASVQALVEIVGSKEALQRLKPYCVNSGRAAAHHIRILTGLSTDDAASIMVLWAGIVNPHLTYTKVAVKASSKDYAIGEMVDCAINGRCSEACYSSCVFAGSGGNNLNPDYEIELTKCIPWGDEYCCFKASRRGVEPSGIPTINAPIPEISTELAYFLSNAYTGEMWVNATRAFLDATGPNICEERLCAEMRKSGQILGDRLESVSNTSDDVLGHVIHWLNTLHQKKESYASEIGCSKGEITECPFSSSPAEICLQYQAFFNGVCEVINPDYEFTYDRMMTRGDKTCHWVVRKKGEPAKEKPKKEAPLDDPAKILAIRYARGELSENEFDKKMAQLRKHGLVK